MTRVWITDLAQTEATLRRRVLLEGIVNIVWFGWLLGLGKTTGHRLGKRIVVRYIRLLRFLRACRQKWIASVLGAT